MGRAKRTTEFRNLAEQHHVSPLLLAEYLSLCVETWSSSDGRAVFPLRRTIGDGLGCTKRHVARLRAAAIAGGFETTVPRYYRDANGATKRTSNSSRFHIPDLYAPLSSKNLPGGTESAVDDDAARAAARDAVVKAESLDPAWDAYMRDGTLPARTVPTPRPVVEAAAPTVVDDPGRSERRRFATERVAEIRRKLKSERVEGAHPDERAPG